MIYGKLSKIKEYLGIHPNLDLGIDWLAKQDVNQLPLGKHEIKGDEVFCIVLNADSYDDTTKQHEVHHHYADIQVAVDDEMFYYDDESRMGKPKGEYVPADDYQLFEIDDHRNFFKPRREDFLIFLPGEGHTPKYTGDLRKLKKVVVKVKMK
ncbi:YhcH/YjgK/YiaL family protein [Mycoplasmoides fastidiosum]|uniref:YhcH/YjgK/YiaL family protein n=1 Tax=Mycoplasmoides fastidiosum TaxID=92758 RepID=A0ABU0LYW5_9BACT|nr:YhcH/YjgK/YiaL family protein [Mycoplasmoides fastidiosum]MDQ0513880.1 YhcH/YjgK/YiaL family protein [Mycoplasmoides fastidiosum]UUD37706.1 YhcH/YjgK/YiaL family protein [Mycoplasmoides fastidiosum]